MPVAARASSSTPRVARISSRVVGGGAQDRPQLRRQDVAALQREADAAHAEERVGLGRHRQRGERLVGAGVEGADDERAAFERLRDVAQGLRLLVLVGQLGAVEEEELGAQQSDALGAEPHRLGRLRRGAEVGEDLDARAVARRAGLMRALARGGAAGLRVLAALLGVAHDVRRRIDLDRAGLAVKQQGRPLVHGDERVAEADDGGQPEPAREDGGVRGRGAVGGGDAGHERRVEPRGVGGRQLGGDDDPRLGWP
jgi:hypothetical protein